MAKLVLAVLIFLHAAIHLLGLQKSLDPESFPESKFGVTKTWGIVFLLTSVLFGASGVLFISGSKSWWALLLLALLASQTAIIAHFSDAKYGTAVNVLLLLAGLLALGERRFQAETARLTDELSGERRTAVHSYEPSPEDQKLPAPVARYLARVLPEGARAVDEVIIEQVGEFNTSLTEASWHPFVATHRATTHPPGFVWAARVKMFPGLSIFVHDALVGGRGRVAPWVLGLLPLTEAADRGGEVTRGELLRFLAETAWYPTVLRGYPGLSWEPVDDRRARARLAVDGTTASLEMFFDDEDLLIAVRCEDRPRLEKGQPTHTPWIGTWSNYQWHDGLLIPTHGEVAWEIDGRSIPYWRGTVTKIRFDD